MRGTAALETPSLLATVRTQLGEIELHHDLGVFTTQREFRGALDGRKRTTTIRISRESGQEWYELAERVGATWREFPAVAP